MDWLTRMNDAITYIEENLNGHIDYEELAKIACCSANNYFRTFSFITDVSLSEYIRRRRLTLAALELQNSDIKVIDLAFKYGYDSPVSFGRAFAALHGVTPTQARADGVTLKAYPRIAFQISLKGEKEMDYRIETKEAFQVFGVEQIVKMDSDAVDVSEDGVTVTILSKDEQAEEELHEKLHKAAGSLPNFVNQSMGTVHHIFGHRDVAPGTIAHMTFAFRTASSNTEGYTIVDVPSRTWAIFPSEKFSWDDEDDGNGVVRELAKRIYTEWMPTSSYEQVGELEMELHGEDDEFGYVEIWIAVKRKG